MDRIFNIQGANALYKIVYRHYLRAHHRLLRFFCQLLHKEKSGPSGRHNNADLFQGSVVIEDMAGDEIEE